MIRLAGFRPDEDIEIEITGPRPGERLHERLYDEAEEQEPAGHPSISGLRPKVKVDWDRLGLSIKRAGALLRRRRGRASRAGRPVALVRSGLPAAARSRSGDASATRRLRHAIVGLDAASSLDAGAAVRRDPDGRSIPFARPARPPARARGAAPPAVLRGRAAHQRAPRPRARGAHGRASSRSTTSSP